MEGVLISEEYREMTALNFEGFDSILIHIGKCGGTSLREIMVKSRVMGRSGVIHVCKPVYLPGKNFYIAARDPVSRAISAFNCDYSGIVDLGEDEHNFGERAALCKYGTLDRLACALYTHDGELNVDAANDFEKILQLNKRISYYLKEFLEEAPNYAIKGVFMQETLAEDVHRLTGLPGSFLATKNPSRREEGRSLSPRGKANLVQFIQDDYKCLVSLCKTGLIDVNLMQAILANAIAT
jgi:hypothetical protein